MIARGLIVFLAMLTVEVCWVRTVTNVTTAHRWRSAFWSTALYLAGAFAVVQYTENRWMLVPAGLGAFVGTALAVKRST